MRPSATAVLLLLTLASVPVIADTEVAGQGPGGAYYRMIVPDAWNGSLVIWNHGFDFDPPGPDPAVGADQLLVDFHLLQGYAVAASSYRMNGWAVFKTNQDLRELMDVFRANFGEPERIFLYGASLGGIVNAAAVEKGRLGNVVGVLTFCGAVAGSRNWDGALDLRLVYDQVCADVPEAFIPGGAAGLPRNSDLGFSDVANAVNACTGVNDAPNRRSRKQRRNLKDLTKTSKLPESFVQTVMGFATFGLSDLVHDKAKLRGRVGVGNDGVDYGNGKINNGVERVEPDRKGARKLAKNYTPKGKVGDAKIIAIHTDKDGLVIVENVSEYAKVVPPGNLTTAVVVEETPSHCLFSPSEVVAGWEALVDWVDGGVQPGAADLQAGCRELEPFFGGPCRVDPGFVIPDMDVRIRPR